MPQQNARSLNLAQLRTKGYEEMLFLITQPLDFSQTTYETESRNGKINLANITNNFSLTVNSGKKAL